MEPRVLTNEWGGRVNCDCPSHWPTARQIDKKGRDIVSFAISPDWRYDCCSSTSRSYSSRLLKKKVAVFFLRSASSKYLKFWGIEAYAVEKMLVDGLVKIVLRGFDFRFCTWICLLGLIHWHRQSGENEKKLNWALTCLPPISLLISSVPWLSHLFCQKASVWSHQLR